MYEEYALTTEDVDGKEEQKSEEERAHDVGGDAWLGWLKCKMVWCT